MKKIAEFSQPVAAVLQEFDLSHRALLPDLWTFVVDYLGDLKIERIVETAELLLTEQSAPDKDRDSVVTCIKQLTQEAGFIADPIAYVKKLWQEKDQITTASLQGLEKFSHIYLVQSVEKVMNVKIIDERS